MRLNVTKMDSKGRISIPFFMRNLMGLAYGDNLILKINGKNEIVATPLSRSGDPSTDTAAKSVKFGCRYLVKSK